jgi:hypothetical protein
VKRRPDACRFVVSVHPVTERPSCRSASASIDKKRNRRRGQSSSALLHYSKARASARGSRSDFGAAPAQRWLTRSPCAVQPFRLAVSRAVCQPFRLAVARAVCQPFRLGTASRPITQPGAYPKRARTTPPNAYRGSESSCRIVPRRVRPSSEDGHFSQRAVAKASGVADDRDTQCLVDPAAARVPVSRTDDRIGSCSNSLRR